MQVKQFRARTMQEAMARVKTELGREAVLLHTRRFKIGGLFGLFGQEMVEVTAAADEGKPELAAAVPAISRADLAVSTTPLTSSRNSSLAPVVPFTSRAAEAKQSQTAGPGLETQIETVKEMVSQVIRRLDGGDETMTGYPECLKRMFSAMIEAETDEELARDIVARIADLTKRAEFDNTGAVRILGTYLERTLGQPEPIAIKQGSRRIIALIGPTGVGKTTTIAKLAASLALIEKRQVALITADTYRIAAVEQLKTYGDIIGVPVEAVFTPKELKTAIEMHRDADVILLDTAGRSHKNEMQLSELKGFLEAGMPSEIYLVMSVNTSWRDAREAMRCYEKVGFDRLIFTKLDETSHYGLVLNLATQARKPISYFTTGQNVPDDIEVASPHRIARLLLGD